MTDCQLLSLEINGEMLITSQEFYGVHYSICEGGLRIYAGKDGKMQISGEYLKDFIKELSEIAEEYEWKWRKE